MITKEKTEIDVTHLPYSEQAVNFIHSFFYDPIVWRSLCDEDRNAAFVYGFIDNFRIGRNICFVPKVNDKAVGMLYGYYMNASIFEVHQGMFSDARSHSMKIAKLCVDKVFEILKPSVMMGFAPISNRGGVITAHRAGLKIQGKIKNYYMIDGKSEDVYIMVREK